MIAWVALTVVVLLLLVQHPTDRSLAAFAKTYAVPLTPHNVDQLRRYIWWTRVWRVGGVAAAIATLTAITTIRDESFDLGYLPLVAGYSIGSLLGELMRPAERNPTHAAATLERRRVRDYVVTPFVVAAVASMIASLIPAIYLLASNPTRSWARPRADPTGARPQDWFVIALVGVVLAVAITCWLGCQAIVRAPVPADTSDRQAVRHAIRSVAIMSVLGGSSMAAGLVGGKLSQSASPLSSDVAPLRWLLSGVSLLSAVAVLGGMMLTVTSVPRFAPFAGRLPPVPPSERTTPAQLEG